MTRLLSLDLLPTKEQHDDIVLTFGDISRTEDSYYFAHDAAFMGEDTSVAKTSAVLAMLLSQWLERLDASSTCYLPCGFSDQHVTWIRCESTDEVVRLSLGWSEDEGWEFTPSNIGNRVPTEFQPFDEIEPVSAYRPRLLSWIRSNRLMLQSASERQDQS